ncbi:hypothetical protein OG439_07230 [Amycolatopsis sp. NBC_01307]|uniref:hypothetical protein n=1 Tax=Amycolatopsis sp. NBC_01307 TaxID=2903561 RepID=UPI002E10DCE3|nr:hypothetical protein OG439_07230 [Amycolatopsis sp. NBC_01307]
MIDVTSAEEGPALRWPARRGPRVGAATPQLTALFAVRRPMCNCGLGAMAPRHATKSPSASEVGFGVHQERQHPAGRVRHEREYITTASSTAKTAVRNVVA